MPVNQSARIGSEQRIPYSEALRNFPFRSIREKQIDVIKQICEAFNTGYRFVILEAPTGFGKSPVAIALARALGSSYICSATKDLQTQYTRNFPFLRAVKGMSNFSCLVKEDFIENKSYACGKCGVLNETGERNETKSCECEHRTVEYGPCRSERDWFHHSKKLCRLCIARRVGDIMTKIEFHGGCRYRTYLEDYLLECKNTPYEKVELYPLRTNEYQSWFSRSDKKDILSWGHASSFEDFEKIRREFKPCPYYDQLNKGIISSHSIFNYSNFLAFLRLNPDLLPQKNLLVLDEGHSIENQIVDHVGVSVSKRKLQRYMDTDLLGQISFDCETGIEKGWLPFLKKIRQKIAEYIGSIQSVEIRTDARDYLQRISQVVSEIELSPSNWIVSDLVMENGKVSRVEFKPLDISSYCITLFDKCSKTLIMSATILDENVFCKSIGIDSKITKFISVESDFPPKNRPIICMNVDYLNYKSLQLASVQRELTAVVDKIMTDHSNVKGIIHCTSYAQVHFISKYLSMENRERLLMTNPNRFNGREQVINEHFNTQRPTVLISPSLHTGLDLKNDSSRFQIVVKVPYPSREDRWIEAKRKRDSRWYAWQTSVKLVQAYGRSVRSKDDWAKTYILDATFRMFVSRNKFPKWYTEAITDA